MSRELKQKNEELQKAYEELQSLDQAKSRFMILINHELKTPLTNILNYISLLKESDLKPDQQKYLGKVEAGADRLKELIFDVLEFVSAETGQTKVAAKKSKLKPAIEAAADSLRPQLEKKKQQLEMELDSSSFLFDPTLLRNVLLRLLHNASKFGDEASTIRVTAKPTKNGLRVAVENTGKPLDEKTIQKLIRPFEIDENIMNHSKGVGMGLSVCQALLKLQSSQLSFESEGKSVCVAFDLPQSNSAEK
jgi:signal transduction histidine kinase